MILEFNQADISVFEEMLPILKEHSKYIFGPDFVLDPDVEGYKRAIENGGYVLFTLRSEGLLVGYAGFWISKSFHSKSVLLANCDLIYVMPAFRGNGHLFIEACDEVLSGMGVNEVMHSVTKNHDYSMTLTRLGFTEFERLFVKSLKQD